MKVCRKNTVICLMLVLAIMFTCMVNMFAESAAGDKQSVYSVLQNDFSQLICVSKYGNTVSYPENSAEGVVSAAQMGADMVLVSVKMTSDNTLVLMSDSNLSRMCVDASGNSVQKNIQDVGMLELSTFHLRNSTGLSHEKETAYSVPTLQQTIEQLGGKAMLLIDGGWQYRDEIYKLLTDMNALNSAVIISDGSKKEISKWLSDKTAMPLVFSHYDGNVVWNSGAYIKKTTAAGVVSVMLSDNNAYSTSFSKSTVQKLGDKARAVIDMTNPKLCGNRPDTPLGWDDVTSRGFSVIVTDNVEAFNEYRDRVNVARERLSVLVDSASQVDLTLCSTTSANKLKESVSLAKQVAASSVSAMTLESEINSLRQALDGLTERTANDKGDKTITKGRVVAVILVVVGLVMLELVFEYYRKKKIAARKLGKKAKKKVKKDKNDLNFD